METTKVFRLVFEDKEGYSMDQLMVEIRAQMCDGAILVSIDNAPGRYRIENIEEISNRVCSATVEQLECALLEAKAKTEVGLARLLADGWQLFELTCYLNEKGRRTRKRHTETYVFAPGIDLTPWKSRFFVLHNTKGSFVLTGRAMTDFWNWREALPVASWCQFKWTYFA